MRYSFKFPVKAVGGNCNSGGSSENNYSGDSMSTVATKYQHWRMIGNFCTADNGSHGFIADNDDYEL